MINCSCLCYSCETLTPGQHGGEEPPLDWIFNYHYCSPGSYAFDYDGMG